MSEDQIKESLKKQLLKLRSKTLILLVTVFSVVGVLIGYYISGDIFSGPFQDVSVDTLGDSAVRISFETEFPAKTRVMYGTSDIYMNETEINGEFTTSHNISLKGLLPGKRHTIKLYAKELNGREHTSSSYKIK